MSTNNHTAISTGAAANAATINTPLGTLDAAIGNLTTLTTTAKTSAVAAINEVDADATLAVARIGAAASASGSIATSVDTDGTLKAGAVDVAAVIADGIITDAKLAIAIDAPYLLSDQVNFVVEPGRSLDGRARWVNYSSLSIVPDDTANPFGGTGRTLRVSTSATVGIRNVFLDEIGWLPGAALTFSILCRGTAADTWRLNLSAVDALSGGSVVTNVTGTTTAMTGDPQTLSTTITPHASSKRIQVAFSKVTASNPLDVYAIWATPGSASRPFVAGPAIIPPAHHNAVFDPYNLMVAVGASINGLARYDTPSNLTIVAPDSANPFGPDANTLRLGSVTTYGGKLVYCHEAGLVTGDHVQFRAFVLAPAGTVTMDLYFMDALTGGSILSSPDQAWTSDGTTPIVIEAGGTVPAGTERIIVRIIRTSGTGDIDIYAMWGGKSPQTLRPPAPTDIAVTYELLDARGTEATLATRLAVSINDDGTLKPTAIGGDVTQYGADRLYNWRGQIAKIAVGATANAVIGLLGDSWVAQNYLWQELRDILQALHGVGGYGYLSAGSGGGGASVTGTWTVSDEEATSRGIDATHRITTDDSTPATIYWATTCTDVEIHYIAQNNGGSFRYRADAGGWTTVDTNNSGAAAFASATLTGLSNASHTITIEVVTAGSAGITICGIDARITGNNAVVHRIGNSAAEAVNWSQLDATIWQAELAALDVTTLVILLGTNEFQASATPATFKSNLTTIITRARAALPLIDVILFSPGDNGETATYTMSDYDEAMLEVAQASACTYLSGYRLLPDYDAADDRDLMVDTLHPNENGYRMLANELAKLLA